RDARVVSVHVLDGGDVYYTVITRSGRVHIRKYLGAENSSGTENQLDSERPLTAADARAAKLTLGQLPPGVIQSLFTRLHVKDDINGDAVLTGASWTIQVG